MVDWVDWNAGKCDAGASRGFLVGDEPTLWEDPSPKGTTQYKKHRLLYYSGRPVPSGERDLMRGRVF